MNRTSLFLLALAAAPLSANAQAQSAPPLREAWKNASLFLFNDAFSEFQKEKTTAPREATLGEALSLLGIQPKTQKNLARSLSILTALAAENPSDEIGLAARFHLARIDELHRPEPDLPAARKQYLALLEDAPASPFSEIAASRIALIDLHLSAPDPASLDETEARLRPLENFLRTPVGKREFHTMVGLVLNIRQGNPTTILRHLLAASKETFSQKKIESDVLFTIAEIADAQGDTALAKQYYSRFVADFPQDIRTFLIKKRLEDFSAKN